MILAESSATDEKVLRKHYSRAFKININPELDYGICTVHMSKQNAKILLIEICSLRRFTMIAAPVTFAVRAGKQAQY